MILCGPPLPLYIESFPLCSLLHLVDHSLTLEWTYVIHLPLLLCLSLPSAAAKCVCCVWRFLSAAVTQQNQILSHFPLYLESPSQSSASCLPRYCQFLSHSFVSCSCLYFSALCQSSVCLYPDRPACEWSVCDCCGEIGCNAVCACDAIG